MSDAITRNQFISFKISRKNMQVGDRNIESHIFFCIFIYSWKYLDDYDLIYYGILLSIDSLA